MATTLQAQWNAVYGPTAWEFNTLQSRIDAAYFMQRVSMAMTAAAISIANEATGTVNHVNRVGLAKLVLDNPSQWSAPFAQACAAEGLDQTSTDAAINGMMGAIWNGLAGVV